MADRTRFAEERDTSSSHSGCYREVDKHTPLLVLKPHPVIHLCDISPQLAEEADVLHQSDQNKQVLFQWTR